MTTPTPAATALMDEVRELRAALAQERRLIEVALGEKHEAESALAAARGTGE